MMRITRIALIVFGLFFFWTTTAAAGLLVYHIIVQQPAPALPLTVGVDDGSGFSFSTLTDDDGDGRIELPPVPVPGRLALGVTPAAGGVPGCDVWDFMGNGVSDASAPLLANALTDQSLGTDHGELLDPPTLTPGQQFTVADGVLPQWPDIRLVDESGVPDLQTFVEVVDTLPGFTGQVVVSDATVHFTLVPEPSSAALLAICLIAVGYLRLRRNRCDSEGRRFQGRLP